MMQCSKVAHKEVAEHVNFLLVFGLRGSSGFASTALERRPFSTADDAATVTSTTEALCCFTARHTHTHTLKISTNRQWTVWSWPHTSSYITKQNSTKAMAVSVSSPKLCWIFLQNCPKMLFQHQLFVHITLAESSKTIFSSLAPILLQSLQ